MVTRFPKRASLVASVLAALLFGHLARADEPGPSEAAAAPDVRVHHAPPSVAKAKAPLSIEVSFDAPEEVKSATLVYRRSDAQLAAVPFERSSSTARPYVAVIPAADVTTPSVAYAIELLTTDGRRLSAFASRDDMHTVALEEDAGDARERALLGRHGGRRTTVAVAGDLVAFGRTPTQLDGVVLDQKDQYFRLEGQFTYRLFRTIAEFGFRGGVVRGSSPVPGAKHERENEVGMNYGAPRIRVRFIDWLHLDGEALTSVNEVGYSIGGGGAVLVGDPYGTHLTFGFEGIQIFGLRGYTRFDVAVARWLALGTHVEVTTMPHAERPGVRLVGDAKIDLGSFFLGVRGGYQARQFASGGPAVGLTAGYSF